MKALKQLERLKLINEMIKAEKTGSPIEFAATLKISKRQLYTCMEYIKELGLTIEYSKQRRTFHYKNNKELVIDCNVHVLS